MQSITLYFFKYLYTNCSHMGCDSGWASDHLTSVNTLAQPRESILLLGIPSHPNSTYSLTVNTRTCMHERRLTSPAIRRHEDWMAMDFLRWLVAGKMPVLFIKTSFELNNTSTNAKYVLQRSYRLLIHAIYLLIAILYTPMPTQWPNN